MKTYFGMIFAAFVLAAGIFIVGCKSSTAPIVSSYHIVSPSDSLPLGHTWDYWLAAFVNWTYSAVPITAPAIPTIVNGLRFTGFKLVKSGGPTIRIDTTLQYSIPRGTAILIYFSAHFRTTAHDTSWAEVAYDDSLITIGQSIPYGSAAGVTCTIDGDPLRYLDGYFQYTKKPFDVFIADSTYWGIRVDPSHLGHYHASSNGYFIIVDQLSSGDHIIFFHFEKGMSIFDSKSIITVQ